MVIQVAVMVRVTCAVLLVVEVEHGGRLVGALPDLGVHAVKLQGFGLS